MSSLPEKRSSTLASISPISNIEAEIFARLQQHASQARGAYSDATVAAWKSDMAKFMAWCAEAGLTGLPATGSTVAAFVDEAGERHKPASVSRYVASIAHVHKAAGLPNPAAELEVVLALKRLRRAKGTAQRQAPALTRRHINKMLDRAPDTLGGLRNRALLSTAYDTLARRSELAGMELADFALADEDGSGSVNIRRSKTDAEGRGCIRFLAPDTIGRLTTWISAAHIEIGPVFLSVLKGGRIGGPLAGKEVAKIFRRMAREAGVPAEIADRVSGHSTRVGAACDMVGAGLGVAETMQAGGWASAEMISRYTRRLEAKRGAAAKLAKLQRR